MKNRKCPQRKGCWGYVNGVCDGCVIGETINGLRSKIDRLKTQNLKLKTENEELKTENEELKSRIDVLLHPNF